MTVPAWSGTGCGVVVLLVAASGDVELEQAADAAVAVEPGEQRHDGHPLHGGGKVVAHHRAELVGLALEAQVGPLDLLVVLELELEELDHLHRRTGGARDRDTGEPVSGEDLLHRAVADEVARRRSPVAGHHDAGGGPHRDHGRAVRDGERMRGPIAELGGGIATLRPQE